MKFEMYQLSIIGYMWRFFAMMAVVIFAVFTGQLYLLALAPLLFLGMMLGVKVSLNNNQNNTKTSKTVQISNTKQLKKAS